jgi:MYXO-CTERM domain-containing protein
VLNGKKELDLGEEPRQMSEPGLLLMLALLGLVLMRRRIFFRKIQVKNF